MSNATLIIIVILFASFIWFGFGASERENDRLNNPTFDSVNVHYEVKDVYRGYSGTRPYILVEYYYGTRY